MISKVIKRYFCDAALINPEKSFGRMTGWQIHAYGGIDEIQFNEKLKQPVVTSPTELLIKVSASSVNPIDVAMTGGYGSTLLNAIKCNRGIEFPITLGKEFTGTIERRGMNIRSSEFDIGDKVWGVVPIHQQGSHAEYVKVDKSLVSKKPKNLEDIEAATVLYAGLTAFSGIFVSAPFDGYSAALCGKSSGKGKKVLVLGASGGVGHLAVQILQAEGADVIATCSENAKPLVESLGVGKIIDYSSPDCNAQIISEAPYDLILDCAGLGADYAKELRCKFKNYVTFKSPLLKNWDEKGLIFGGLESVRSLITSNIPVLTSGAGVIKWGYFLPLPNGIKYLKDLVESGKLRPIIDSTFNYTELPKAYEKVANGHIRGKVAVKY